MSYYGLYRASTSSQSGCPKEFVTTPRDEIRFPPQVSYKCSACKKEHGFRFIRATQVTTPGQLKSFHKMCANSKIETEVEVP